MPAGTRAVARARTAGLCCGGRRSVAHCLQLRSLWRVPTKAGGGGRSWSAAAIPVESPCCSCKDRAVAAAVARRPDGTGGSGRAGASTRPCSHRRCCCCCVQLARPSFSLCEDPKGLFLAAQPCVPLTRQPFPQAGAGGMSTGAAAFVPGVRGQPTPSPMQSPAMVPL